MSGKRLIPGGVNVLRRALFEILRARMSGVWSGEEARMKRRRSGGDVLDTHLPKNLALWPEPWKARSDPECNVEATKETHVNDSTTMI